MMNMKNDIVTKSGAASLGPAWLNDAIFYEIYPPSFKDSDGDGIGDIPGMIEKLDYIKDSGFTAIWLNPWFDSSWRDGGYDIKDFYNIAPRYGTNDDAKRFFDEVHKRGLRVILDLVICHTALEHPWFVESGKAERNEYSDLFIWCPNLAHRGDVDDKDDYYVSGWAPRGSYKASYFAVQPAINYGFGEVKHDWEMPYDHPMCEKNRQRIHDVMRFWLDMGCDGFRVDMASHVVKRDPTGEYSRRFWREIRENIFDQEYPEAVLLSEWFSPKDSISSGFHLDFLGAGPMFSNYMWQNLPHTIPGRDTIFIDKNRGDLGKFIKDFEKQYAAIKGKGYFCVATGNHDSWRFSFDHNREGLVVAMVVVLTTPGCPLIYYGDEIGMKYMGEHLATEGSASRGGSRTPMQWDATLKNSGFSSADKSALYLPVDASPDAPNVADALAGKNIVYNACVELIQLRKKHKALQSEGDIEFIGGMDNAFPAVWLRTLGEQRVMIAVNSLAESVKRNIDHNGELLTGKDARLENGTLELGQYGYGIWLLKD